MTSVGDCHIPEHSRVVLIQLVQDIGLRFLHIVIGTSDFISNVIEEYFANEIDLFH